MVKVFGNGKWAVNHWSFSYFVRESVIHTKYVHNCVMFAYFPLIICFVLCSLIALFLNAAFMYKLTIVYWSTWREKKGTLILTFWLESREQNNELRMRPQISRGAVKEQTRLSRSSGIIPVLQVTVICLRGLWRRGLQHTHDAFTLLLAMLSILFLLYPFLCQHSFISPMLWYASVCDVVCLSPVGFETRTLRLPDCLLPHLSVSWLLSPFNLHVCSALCDFI